jgi:hypothetical protein
MRDRDTLSSYLRGPELTRYPVDSEVVFPDESPFNFPASRILLCKQSRHKDHIAVLLDNRH